MTDEEQGMEPKLEAAGAGLPFIQEWVLRHVAFPLLRRVISWERALAIFEQQGRELLSLVREVPDELRGRQILVPRMLGIEDSSRYWSMMMALDHLLIVSQGVAGLMAKLSGGEQIDAVVSTADVKPDINPAANTERKFEVLLARFRRQTNASVTERNTSRCHVHPWFGCLNPQGWMVMLAVHQWIHKRQVREIHRRLMASMA